MLIRNIPYPGFANVLAAAEAEMVRLDVTWTKETRRGTVAIRGALRYAPELDPTEATRRRAALSGRRTCGVTWEAHRAFMLRVFDRYPEAIIRTWMAAYNGRDDFMAKHPATADINVGSRFQPVRFADL